jgi:diguanylate cyclase (GGDEF)-like protein
MQCLQSHALDNKHLPQSFIYTGINSAIIMINIDDFKKVNDNCGHDKGDLILKNTAETISKHIRSTDILCRWDQEEFLLICNGLKEDDMITLTDKLLH